MLEITFDRAARPPAQLCASAASSAPSAGSAASDGCASSGGKGFVDALFEFSEPLGAAYTGAWRNGFTFEIVIADAANASLGVRSDRFVGSEVTTHLWAVPGSATSQAVARGDFRETIGAPPLGLRLGLGLGLG